LIEELGLRGHQELHYDGYVEKLEIIQQEDGTEVVEFRQGSTKTRSAGLSLRRRTTPQVMYSTKNFLVIRLSNVIQLLQNVTKRYVLFATEGNKENPANVAKEMRVAKDENGKFNLFCSRRRANKDITDKDITDKLVISNNLQ